MKKSLFALLVFLVTNTLYSQHDNTQVQVITNELTQLYSLDAVQEEAVKQIQERYFTNLSILENIKDGDQQLYIRKLQALKTDTDAAIVNLLYPDQVAIHQQQKAIKQQEKVSLVRQMKANGASKEAIDRILSNQ